MLDFDEGYREGGFLKEGFTRLLTEAER